MTMKNTQQNQPAGPENAPAQFIPQCKFLRSKEMYYEQAGEEDAQFASDVFWCASHWRPSGPTASQPEKAIANPAAHAMTCHKEGH